MKVKKVSIQNSRNGSKLDHKKNHQSFQEKMFENKYFNSSATLPTQFSASFYTVQEKQKS
ncbi:hypothetical protein ACFL1D_01965 [Candidatus Omnitrophota bacterium]